MKNKIIIENCNLFTHDGPKDVHSILIEDGLILKLSNDRTIAASDARRIDARGGTVLPGLIDTHCHAFELGSMRRILDLSDVRSITSLRLRLFAFKQRSEKGEWIIGRGWDQEQLVERRYPKREDIDDITPENPVLLKRVCGHIALINSKAIEQLGIDDISNSDYDTYEGKLTGIIRERALEDAIAKIPSSAELLMEDILKAQYDASRFGLTTIHCILSINYKRELEAISKLYERNKLSIRLRLYVPFDALDYIERNKLNESLASDMLRINGVKIFADGSLGARTAALSKPYSDDPLNMGMLRYDDDQLEDMVRIADEMDKQVIIHAIGDRAIEQSINAIVKSSKKLNGRNRIEHCSLCPYELIKRIADGRISVTVQPHFIISDIWAMARLGERRILDLYPFKSLLNNGISVSAGSDAPVEPINPILGIWASIAGNNYAPEQRLGLEEAIRMYTVNAAYNGLDEELIGSIREGSVADLTILDSNIDGMHPAMIRKVGIAATIVNGNLIYSYEGLD